MIHTYLSNINEHSERNKNCLLCVCVCVCVYVCIYIYIFLFVYICHCFCSWTSVMVNCNGRKEKPGQFMLYFVQHYKREELIN